MNVGMCEVLAEMDAGTCAVENVRGLLVRLDGRHVDVFNGAHGMEKDLADLARRVRKVRCLSTRFKGVELSPEVKKMLELAQRHRLAV